MLKLCERFSDFTGCQ